MKSALIFFFGCLALFFKSALACDQYLTDSPFFSEYSIARTIEKLGDDGKIF